MKNYIVLLLIGSLAIPCLAQTSEVSSFNYSQQFDITFWQTLPFAFFWGRQIFISNPANLEYGLAVAVAVSLGNAYVHTNNGLRNKL